MKWFRLETADGAVARLSVMLKGLPQLARRLLDGVPAGAIDDATRRVLQQTAEGHPPSVWS